MADLITLQHLQAWVRFPSAGATASAVLDSGPTEIASITATDIGAWANSVQWTVTHGLLLTWSLRLSGLGMVQTFDGLDTSLGFDNTGSVQPTTTYRGQSDPQPAWVTIEKLANGRPAPDSGLLDGGDNVRNGVDLSSLASNVDMMIGGDKTFYERNPLVPELVRGWLAPQASWSDLDQSGRDNFLTALLSAIDD